MIAPANGWPDPTRPGVPLNPERDGFHWISANGNAPKPYLWSIYVSPSGRFPEWIGLGTAGWTANRLSASYHGPCPNPSDLAALREQIARLTERERVLVETLTGVREFLRSPEWGTVRYMEGSAVYSDLSNAADDIDAALIPPAAP